MHKGSSLNIESYKPKNLGHVFFENEAYESTGGQPITSKTTIFFAIFKGCNYFDVTTTNSKAELSNILTRKKQILMAVVIKTLTGSRKGLGRPTDSTKKMDLWRV